MNRRTFLAASGSVLSVGVGAYGLYTRDAREDVPGSDGSGTTPAEDTREATGSSPADSTATSKPEAETRAGRTLSGMSPRSFSSSYTEAVEEWLGARQAITVFFADMDRSDEGIEQRVSTLETVWNRGAVPLMFWQPYFGASDDDRQRVTQAVADGEYDDRLHAWADAIAEWAVRPDGTDRRVYLNLAPELNGSWVPWGIPTPETTPDSYIRMWRHIHDVVMATDLESDHVQWVWTVNHTSSGSVPLAECYPGDRYADWVSITGYNWSNWGGWDTAEGIYGDALRTVREFSDVPAAFSEFGASADCEDGHCPERKDEWIASVYDFMADNDVRMACWFDHAVEKDGTDWGVFDAEFGPDRFQHGGTEYRAYGTYRDVIGRDDVLTAHPNSPRRLTDEEFDGSFAEQ
ncbi:glycoside hydrolase family 26 protein [Haloarchaeobius sp. HRN-SO-5]|uniref:glycoside hydrolase family 26 protein n=1 Tax=Haloarchaeobius sp. HRN-SO-5 TaxID=3446118 RepID=UPI003EBC1227